MPDAAIVALTKEVQTKLAAATLSQTFAPTRSYADWAIELAGPTELLVDVVANTMRQKCELASFDTLKYTLPVDIAVRRRFDADKQNQDTGRVEVAEVDALVLLVQEIHELFVPPVLANFESGTWLETEILTNPLKLHLREHRQFTGVVRVTFETFRTLI